MSPLLVMFVLPLVGGVPPAHVIPVQGGWSGPPPNLVLAPAPKTYFVFFDKGQVAMTERAHEAVKSAAEATKRIPYTRIEVSGHTDSVGGVEDNQALSASRAQAVAAELVRNGVPREAIATVGYGDTRLLVPTRQGVDEAQNRRVEIIVR